MHAHVKHVLRSRPIEQNVLRCLIKCLMALKFDQTQPNSTKQGVQTDTCYFLLSQQNYDSYILFKNDLYNKGTSNMDNFLWPFVVLKAVLYVLASHWPAMVASWQDLSLMRPTAVARK